MAIQESVEKPKEAISRQAELPQDCVVTLPPPSEPSGPVLAQPYPRTAQEYMPPPPPEPGDTSPGKSGLPGVMKFLQEHLATPGQATDKTASSPAPSQANRSPVKSTIKGEGDGKLRIHIYDEDIHKVLDLLSEQGNLNILASKEWKAKYQPRSTEWIWTARWMQYSNRRVTWPSGMEITFLWARLRISTIWSSLWIKSVREFTSPITLRPRN